jgi:hypothetical protein
MIRRLLEEEKSDNKKAWSSFTLIFSGWNHREYKAAKTKKSKNKVDSKGRHKVS